MLISVRNHLKAGENIELLLPHETFTIDTQTILDADGNKIDQAHAGNQIYLPSPRHTPKGALLRKKITTGKQ